MNIPLSEFIPFFALYAETHFRFFKRFPNFLAKAEPEVVFDLPRRGLHGSPIPLLLLINDRDKYPIELIEVKIAYCIIGDRPKLHRIQNIAQYVIDHPLKHQSTAYNIPLPADLFLEISTYQINCLAILKTKHGRTLEVLNDNYIGSSKRSFTCLISNNTYPSQDIVSYGDMHVHSQFSQSHVEFGPPLEILKEWARASSLDFLGITDHSYDLACSLSDYFIEEESTPRWVLMKAECTRLSEAHSALLIPGEEISVLNKKNKVVHLLRFGSDRYIPGSLDGARKKKVFNKSSTLELLATTQDKDTEVLLAAHPGSRARFMQSVFLHRGNWDTADLAQPIDGLQAVNSGFGKSWKYAKMLWIKELLNGHKLALVAGTDAHGDANRYRCIGIPFLRILELFNRYLGSTRTGLYGKPKTKTDVLDAIRNGKTFVTSGPYANLLDRNNPYCSLISTHELRREITVITSEFKSTCEFGYLQRIRVMGGIKGAKQEVVIVDKLFAESQQMLEESLDISLPDLALFYIRGEVGCFSKTGSEVVAFTSPCYFQT